MKTKVLFLLFSLFVALSCHNDQEVLTQESRSLASIEEIYEQSKQLTLAHNEMLDVFYNHTLLDGTKFNKPLYDGDIELFASQFVNVLNKQPMTRSGKQSELIDVAQVIKIAQMNDAITNSKKITRNSELSDVAYLEIFCDEFYSIASSDITPANLDLTIKSVLEKVMAKYPNLSDSQKEKLAFVSSLTYNSYNYWYKRAIDWYMNLKEGENVQTRGIWGDLWGAVKSGTQKWAYADTKGAISAMGVSGILGKSVAPVTLLAGAAFGSTVGAVENFFN